MMRIFALASCPLDSPLVANSERRTLICTRTRQCCRPFIVCLREIHYQLVIKENSSVYVAFYHSGFKV